MNLGARRAAADALLFLHADTQVPRGGLDRILRTLTETPSAVGGAFCRRFDSPSLLLRFTTRLAGWRSRHLGLFLGDQGIFVRRAIFEELRGFDESLALCEDLDFARRLRGKGRVVTLNPGVVSSARRFEARGPLRTTIDDLRRAWEYFVNR
jgi:GT2 family glycosyltransferase